MRVVIESPLKGATAEEFQRNYRYLLWCCRAEYEGGNEPIASHLVCPWFMNDQVPEERTKGIECSWFWQGEPHMFYRDIGFSEGMTRAKIECALGGIAFYDRRLKDFSPQHWAAFQNGEWPSHTPGFSLERQETAALRRQLESARHELDRLGQIHEREMAQSEQSVAQTVLDIASRVEVICRSNTKGEVQTVYFSYPKKESDT